MLKLAELIQMRNQGYWLCRRPTMQMPWKHKLLWKGWKHKIRLGGQEIMETSCPPPVVHNRFLFPWLFPIWLASHNAKHSHYRHSNDCCWALSKSGHLHVINAKPQGNYRTRPVTLHLRTKTGREDVMNLFIAALQT